MCHPHNEVIKACNFLSDLESGPAEMRMFANIVCQTLFTSLWGQFTFKTFSPVQN